MATKKHTQIKFSSQRLTLRVGLTVNLGNYESAQYMAEISAEVLDEANEQIAFNVLHDKCVKAIATGLSLKPEHVDRQLKGEG